VSADVEALPNEHDLVEGDHAMVSVADIKGQAHLFGERDRQGPGRPPARRVDPAGQL